MLNKYRLILLREEDSPINDEVIKWFHSKWKIPEIEYKKSIEECQKKKVGILHWYVMMDKNEIIAGMDVIENYCTAIEDSQKEVKVYIW